MCEIPRQPLGCLELLVHVKACHRTLVVEVEQEGSNERNVLKEGNLRIGLEVSGLTVGAMVKRCKWPECSAQATPM